MTATCRACGAPAESLRACPSCGELDAYIISAADTIRAPNNPIAAASIREIAEASIYRAFASGIRATLERAIDDGEAIAGHTWIVGLLVGTLFRVEYLALEAEAES